MEHSVFPALIGLLVTAGSPDQDFVATVKVNVDCRTHAHVVTVSGSGWCGRYAVDSFLIIERLPEQTVQSHRPPVPEGRRLEHRPGLSS